MRLLAIITLIIFVAAGIVLGALNAGMVDYDFGFAQVQLPKGQRCWGRWSSDGCSAG
jgi:hypothetical protein